MDIRRCNNLESEIRLYVISLIILLFQKRLVIKTAREIFDYAFEKFGITDKSSVLMVGDSLTSDMKGGEDYGIDTCWYNPSLKENKASVKPTYEVKESAAELVEVAEEKVVSF